MPIVKKYGFVLKQSKAIAELQATASVWIHEVTGAQFVSVQNQDANKSFAITFPTLPSDNSGVAHILEHSVLNGSRKFPVKEPFVELMKSSVCSFLNAFTYPDKTVYPLASQNEEDFYNLIDVYLDAVFFPTLSEQTFLQEGWHYEPLDTEWIYKGVVFNEMKGAGSSPDRCVWQATQEQLFPDTPYRWDSGGVPESIVELTYSQFVQFHADNYHPANALIWMSGNDSEEKRLQTLDEYLGKFSPSKTRKTVPLQTWNRGVLHKKMKYPASSADRKQVFATQTWVLPESLEVESQIELSLLEYLLIGTSTAPLRKALIDSGLGTDLAGGGMEFDMRQKTFSVGLRGIREEAAEQVFAIITKVLEELATVGFAESAVQAALTTTEFSLRENNSGSFPQGLSMGLRLLRSWLYGAEPLALLSFEIPLAKVTASLAADTHFLQKKITSLFIQNTHALKLTLVPDSNIITAQAAQEKKRLAAFSKQISELEEKQLRQTAKQLQLAQRTPDTADALRTLPKLRVEDLQSEVRIVPTEEMRLHGSAGYVHELQTNGVVYIDIAWSINHIQQSQLPLLALFTSALTEFGSKKFPEDLLQTVIDSKTGGLEAQVFVGHRVASEQPEEYCMLRVKALPSQLKGTFELLHSLITETVWDNKVRFLQLIAEECAQFEASMIEDGHRLLGTRLGSHLTPAGAVVEMLSGFTQLQYLRSLKSQVESDWQKVVAQLENIAHDTFAQNCTWNITVSAKDKTKSITALSEFLEKLPINNLVATDKKQQRMAIQSPFEEVLTIATPINFVGTAMRLPLTDTTLSGSVMVATQLLRTDYLWNTVRVQGGAYGAGVRIDPLTGSVIATSYRDPHIQETIAAFASMAEYLQTVTISPEELEKSKIGTVGDLDQYKLPDAQGFTAFIQQLTGMTTAIRQELRDAVFATTIEDLHKLGKQLASGFSHTAVMTSPEKVSLVGNEVVIQPLLPESNNI